MMNVKVSSALLVVLAVALAACGDGATEMPPAAAEGRQIARDQGCAACHGTDGQGGVGPAWVGLFGSPVELEDGSVVAANTEYLRRSISDPQADIVAGYTTKMPANTLDEDQISAVIAYIEFLGADE